MHVSKVVSRKQKVSASLVKPCRVATLPLSMQPKKSCKVIAWRTRPNAKTSKVITDGADTNNGTAEAQLFLSLPQGEYLLLATASSVSGGTYVLRSQTVPVRNCTEDSAAVPASVRGSLGSSDCRYADYVPFTSYFSFSHVYKVEIPTKGIFTADLISTQFDAYLYILRDNKQVIAEDDDTGGNSNSRLILNLSPGTYTLVATSYDNGETGSFELRTSLADVPNCPIADFTASKFNPSMTIS